MNKPNGRDGDTVPTGDAARPAAPATASPLAPGSQVDHFKVLRLLGEGGIGEVYLARDTQLGRKVALKVLRPQVLGTTSRNQRFLIEARTTAKFSHPNIVAIHAVGQVGGSPYVALEYLRGQTLRDRIQEAKLGQGETVRIVQAIADALREAHRHKILHGDLKPENVMIPRDGRVRVLDFGLSKVIAADTGDEAPVDTLAADASEISDISFGDGNLLTQTREIVGTPTYMAPEQWSRQPVSGVTDVWALGIMLLEMVTGEHPFAGLDRMQIGEFVLGPAPLEAPPEEIPRPLASLIEECVAKDPADRPSINEVRQRLQDLLTLDDRHIELVPFRGLLPCGERDAGRFHGRDGEVDAFVERLRREVVLTVVGPSGAGKSSFVQAGVIPRLREQGRWVVLTMTPGRAPMSTLASRVLHGDSSWDSGSGATPGGEGGDSRWRSGGKGGAGRAEAEKGLVRSLLEHPPLLGLRLLQLAGQPAPAVAARPVRAGGRDGRRAGPPRRRDRGRPRR